MSQALSAQRRQQLIREIRHRRASAATRKRRLAEQSPLQFRRLIQMTDDGKLFGQVMQPWQERDFAALDPAWMSLAGVARQDSSRNVAQPRQRAYIERPRGHSKTSDTALQIAWILFASRRSVRGLAAAADQAQARLIHESLASLIRRNSELFQDFKVTADEIRNTCTGSRLQVISSEVNSSYGVLPDFVICDELCHWNGPAMWYSLLSSAAKKPGCVLVVLTNAGIGRGWQWEVRESARSDSTWYFSSLEGPHAPWISAATLEEQQRMLPPPVYRRLWLNQWQHSDGEFITLAEAEACRDETLVPVASGRRGISYVAAIDYAEKRDFTVGCVCHWEQGRIVVDRMDVVCPTPAQPTPVAWVEDWIHRTAQAFAAVTFMIDEYQLIGTIQRLNQQFDLHRFEFAGGRGNHLLAVNLRSLILQKQLAWYPGCGDVPGSPLGRDDLETELASLILKQSTSGRVRIDHVADGCHHDDRSFTLGAACLHLVEHDPQAAPFLEINPPSAEGGFYW